ncbi:hypothetical protein H0H93_015504, partial [Arthromyces matolae]
MTVLTYKLGCFVLRTPQKRKEGGRVYKNSEYNPKPSTYEVETAMNMVVNSENVDQQLHNVSRTLIALATTIDQRQSTLNPAVRSRDLLNQRLLTAVSVLTENQWISNGGREHNITLVPGNPQHTSVNKTNYACLEPELSPTCSIFTKSRLPERTLTVVSVALNPFWRSSDQFDSGSRRARVWISTLVQTTGIRTAYASTYWTWPAAIQSVCGLLDGQVTLTIPIPRRVPTTTSSIAIGFFDSTRGSPDGHNTSHTYVICGTSILERDHHLLLCQRPLVCLTSFSAHYQWPILDEYYSKFVNPTNSEPHHHHTWAMGHWQPPLETTTRINDPNRIPELCHGLKPQSLHPLTTLSSWFSINLWPDLEIFGNEANSNLIHIGDISSSTPNDVPHSMEPFPVFMIDLYLHAESIYGSITSSIICRSTVAKSPNLPEHLIMPEQTKASIVDLIYVDNPFGITVVIEIFEGFIHLHRNFNLKP